MTSPYSEQPPVWPASSAFGGPHSDHVGPVRAMGVPGAGVPAGAALVPMTGPVRRGPSAPAAISGADVTSAATTGPEPEHSAGQDAPVLPAGWPMVPRGEPLGSGAIDRDVIDGTGPRRGGGERPTGPGQQGLGRGSAAASGATGVDPAAATYAMLDALFARAPVGLALLDRAGRFVRVNETLARLDRRPARDHLGRTVSEVLGDTGQELDTLLGRVLRTGEPVVDLEVGVAGAAGAPARTWLASWFPVSEPQLGPVGVAFVALDVTGMAAAERDRVRVEARYRALVDASGTDIFHAGADGGLDVDLPGWRAATGQRPADLTGSGWLAGVHPDDRDRVARLWHGVLERGAAFEAEFRLVESAGSGTGSRTVAARVLPVPAAGVGAGGDALRGGDARPVEWLGIVRDLTGERATEAARAQAAGRADAAEQQVRASEEQAQSATLRAEAAEKQAAAAEKQVAAAERQAQDAEERREAAEAQARAALEQAQAAEQEARTALEQAQSAEQEARTAQEQARTAGEKADTIGRQAEAAQARASAAERLIEAAEQRVSEAEARTQAAQARAGSATGDIEAAEARVRAAEQRADVADLRAQAAVDRAEAADRRAEDAVDRAEGAQRREQEARQQADESAERAAEATRRADAAVEQVAVAARQVEQAQALAQASDGRVEAGRRFAAALAAAGTVREVIAAVLDAGGQAVRAVARGVALVDADSDELRFARPAEGTGASGGRVASWPDVALGAVHPVAEVVRGGRALFLSDREELLTRWPVAGLADAVSAAGEQAWALLPLPGADGSLLGVVTFGFAAPRTFSPAERAHLTGLATAAARAIERATAHDRALADIADGEQTLAAAQAERAARERADARLELLARATATVTATEDPHEALRAYLNLLAGETADVCALHLVVAEPTSTPGTGTPAADADSATDVGSATEADVEAGVHVGDEPGVQEGVDAGLGAGERRDAEAASEPQVGSDAGSGTGGVARSGIAAEPVAGGACPAAGGAPTDGGDGSGAPQLAPFADAGTGMSAAPGAGWAAALTTPANPFRQVAAAGDGLILSHEAGGWDPPADVARWLRQIDAHTTAVLPVSGVGGVAAVLSLTIAGDRAPFDEQDLPFLTELAARAGTALARLDLDRSARGEAASLHETLLGARPAVPTGLQVSARYLPAGSAGAAGGQWYDVIDLGAGRVALVIGEARGGGMAATAAMAQLRAAARACAHLDLPPGDVLSLLGSVVADLPGRQGATCIYAIAELDTGVLTLASAGHPPPLVIAPDGLVSRLYMAVGAPLGVGGGEGAVTAGATEYTVRLGPGYLIALFTDGLVRAGGRDADAGASALAAALAHSGDGRAGSLDALVSAACAGLGRGGDPAPADDAVALLFARLPDESMAGPVLLDVAVEGAASLRAVRAQSRLVLENASLPGDVVDTVVLVLSELTSNAVRHGRSPLSVRLRRLGSRVVVEVADGGGRLPRRRSAAADDEAGRGLDLVDHLAARHGVRPVVDGKVVWAEVDLGVPPVPAAD